MGPGSVSMPAPSSRLVLNGQRGELVRASAVRRGKRGGVLDEKAATALRNHSEAERRRRERINSHLAGLRAMLPGSGKLDKAALLAEVINHVKLLQMAAAEHGQGYTIPSDTDQVAVCCEAQTANSTISTTTTLLIRASICCDDSPELYPKLKQSLQSVDARVVRAEISCLSGRVKIVFFIMQDIDGVDSNIDIVVDSIKQALRSVLQRVNSSMEFIPGAGSFLNKRRKILHFDSSSSSS